MIKSRNTRQRAVVLDVLRQTRSHPTAESIFREARKRLPSISLGTVYRNLALLGEQGAVREIRCDDGGGSRFEADIGAHAHFHCVQCNSVLDFPIPEPLEAFDWPGLEPVGSVERIQLLVTGVCSACTRAPAPGG